MNTAPEVITEGEEVVVYDPDSIIAGRYRVETRIIGGQGVVYRCRDKVNGETVALKTFRHPAAGAFAKSHHQRNSLLHESAHWIAFGHHPNIVAARRIETSNDFHGIYLVLDWVPGAPDTDGSDLRSLIKARRTLRTSQALEIAIGVVRGMIHATNRRKGLLHLDLKPGNILMHESGRAMVTDFGLVNFSKLPEESDVAEKPVDIERIRRLGTAIYRAPEVWNPNQGIDLGADVYSLGCVMYEMLTGQRAAIGTTQDELGESHLTGNLSAVPPGVPPRTVEILHRCLAREPVDRYSDWIELESALVNALEKDTGKRAVPLETDPQQNRLDRINYGWSRHAIAAAYTEIGNFGEAGNLFTEALDCGVAENDSELEGAGLEGVGSIYASMNRHGDAIPVLNKAKDIAETLGSEHNLLRIRSTLGGCQAAIGNYEGAVTELQDVLELASAGSNQEIQVLALGNLGSAHAMAREFGKAACFYEQLVILSQSINLPSLETQALISLGSAQADNGNSKKAIRNLGKAVTIALNRGDSLSAVSGFLLGARTHFQTRDFKRAAPGYEQACRLARDIGDRYGQVDAITGLALTHLELGNTILAKRKLMRAIVLHRRLDNRPGEGEAFALLGLLYGKHLDNPDKAKACLTEAIHIYGSIGEQAEVNRLNKILGACTGTNLDN